MFYFDGQSDPPTAFELKDVQDKLTAERKRQILSSCCSDLAHGLLFACLYFLHHLSGPATLTAVILATACALVLAGTVAQPLRRSDIITVLATSCCSGLVTPLLLSLGMNQATAPSIIAGCGSASIVIFGAFLGGRVKQVMIDLEDLKPFYDDSGAIKELSEMSKTFPEIARYREQASHLLRPNLTYGELKAMRDWIQDHRITL